mmetsp:Transcript_11028/g.21612  ORF Transcript_11028/g.21612 Transcript_11028/m.21612 type:complete len:129 (-) Transcript_11028:1910-2296(-)
MTELETIVAEVTSRTNLYRAIGKFAEETARTFENIKQKGLSEGLVMDAETEVEVLGKVIDESIMRFLQKEVNKLHRSEEKTISRQPLLLAHPSGYTHDINRDLDILSSSLMSDLINSDLGTQERFLGL